MKIMVLAGDYWHPANTVEPIMEYLKDTGDSYVFTEDPEEFYKDDYDVLVIFKAGVENIQIPTPAWCDDKWTECFLNRVENGMGVVSVHSGITFFPLDNKIASEVFEASFVSHPEQCPVKFIPLVKHPVFEGIEEFELNGTDEHYVMKFVENYKSTIIAESESMHGKQPAVWVNTYGKGKICMFTPGHETRIITSPEYVRLIKNMIKYCAN